MEQKERNVKITLAKISGVKTSVLAKKYKTTLANINRIIADTKAKYSELLIK